MHSFWRHVEMSKICWKNYHKALEDLDKINVIDANNAIILNNLGDVKKMLKDNLSKGGNHNF
jgi:hypothetical protein